VLDPRGRGVGRREDDSPYDVVHVFRLGTVPFAEPWLQAKRAETRTWLDLDDVESASHRRLAALHEQLGEHERANVELRLSAEAESRERAALTRFDRVFLASWGERERLPRGGRATVAELRNVLRLPDRLLTSPPATPVTLLFVGTLGHFPNVDAVRWFANDVLPLIQRASARAVVLRVVGRGDHPDLHSLAQRPGVELLGAVDDLTPHYADARAVVVPLRAGSGTRIKIIEAFGYGRPVVGTSIAFEGIAAQHRVHALIADSSEALAECCLEVIADADLAFSLTDAARSLATEQYSPEALTGAVATL
jgi:glycosyltransferase involved in cell wall biosynthesis